MFVFTLRSKTNALNISQKMIEMFVRTKHKIDKRHEFALVVVNDDALWVSSSWLHLNTADHLRPSKDKGQQNVLIGTTVNQHHLPPTAPAQFASTRPPFSCISIA